MTKTKELIERRLFGTPTVCLIGALALAALWPLLRPYDWLTRDAQIYALQAMARARPSLFANDLYFLFGSQDRFTVLTGLVAPLYGRLGAEHASALLTLLGNLLWWSACYALARTVVGARKAWISVAVVMVLPGWYGGGGEVFRYAESYFSARLPAEALGLLALSLRVRGHRWLAIAAVLVTLAVHPLMGASCAAMLVLLSISIRRWAVTVGLAILATGIAVLVAKLSPVGRLAVIDPEWHQIIATRSAFLFTTRWSSFDWFRAGSVIAMLAVAATWNANPTTRRIAVAALVVGAGGLAVTIIGCDAVPVEIILQSQPWRALWLATVVAFLLVPSTVATAWNSGPIGRASALFVLVAVCGLSPTADLVAVAAAAAIGALGRDTPRSTPRLLLLAAAAALVVTVTVNVLGIVNVLKVPVFGGSGDPRLEAVRNVAAFGVPALILATILWYLLWGRGDAVSMFVAGGLTCALAVFVAPPAAGEFRDTAYTGAKFAQFSDWRKRIPPGTNVLWPASPTSAWFLLERPSYVSVAQLAGVVFSRPLAIESYARIRRLRSYVSTGWAMGNATHVGDGVRSLTLPVLRDVCSLPDLGFVVAKEQVTESAPWHEWPDSSHRVYLYDCREFR